MTRGIVMFAHNGNTDYYRMAVHSAQRANRFLNLPVTVITDNETLETTSAPHYEFDKTVIVEADKSNIRGKSTWINKGRYQVYDLTPYDDTLVLDTDFMINSDRLLSLFDDGDFKCYRNSRYLLSDKKNEMMGTLSLSIYWATVMRFRKSPRIRDMFKMIEMVQNNYEHYAELHGFIPYTYRNDYALTIALRTVNGHLEYDGDFITGELTHVGENVLVDRIDDTSYRVLSDITINGRKRRQYIKIKDFDFHMLNKNNFMSLVI
jgi:hypothetical protein